MSFIGEQYLRDLTPISNNLDIELVKPQIEYYEDAYLKDILGDSLYNDLVTKYNAQTLSSIEDTLMLIIKKAVAYGSAQLSMPFINTQVRAKGLMNINAENATQSEIERERLLRQELRDRTNYYETRVRKFLQTNSSSFPLYEYDNDDINPSSEINYECDIYIESCSKRCDE